jgi:hypothetical protein
MTPYSFNLSDLVQLVVSFGSMAGAAALVAILVDLFKRFGIVKDGDAPRWSAALNLLFLIALVSARYFAPQFSVEFLDAQAGAVAEVAAVVLSFVMQIAVSPAVHFQALANDSPVAFSNSGLD